MHSDSEPVVRPGSSQQQPGSTSSRRVGGQQDTELQELPGPPIHLSRRRKPKFIAGGGGSDVAVYPGRHMELPVEGREAEQGDAAASSSEHVLQPVHNTPT